MSYSFKAVEKKWQEIWKKNKTFSFSNNSKDQYYVLEQFPYPSGNLHMGHLRVYTIGDAIARFKKMQGYDVLHPMGFDAFGLPAENAAIEKGIHPKKWTLENIARMRNQMEMLGLSLDLDREVITCLPEYYKHEQQMFIDFYNKGLAYQKESEVNWDPVDKTVLANEQVIDGKGWRSGALVEKKKLNQWFLKVSKYSKELLDGLDKLPNWPEKVKLMQKNWIGKSEGAEIHFKTEDEEGLVVFSTRPDTIFGCTFLAIAPLHPISIESSKTNTKIANFIENESKSSTKQADLDTKEKLGVFTGKYAINPITKKKIPIWIANFVVMDYGTGALFGCPAHDERDFEFATKYNIEIIKVVKSEKLPFTEFGEVINSDFLNGLSSQKAKDVVIKKLEEEKLGKSQINYKLRDWGVSRQRYWGCPIPMVYCNSCGVVPEKSENLPITLPEDVEFTGQGNPIELHPSWKNCKCPKCGKDATRETETLDTFFESSWYFLRYIDANDTTKAFDKKHVQKVMPVADYVGGIEHAILHLLYSRFFVKALRDCGYFGDDLFNDECEPFNRLLTQGMVLHEAFKDENDRCVSPDEIINIDGKLKTKDGLLVFSKGIEKMSKSKKNVVDPLNILENYGADTARLFMLSDYPLEFDLNWQDSGVKTAHKLLTRIHNLAENLKEKQAQIGSATQENEFFLNLKIKEIKECYEKFQFNIVIAKIYELVNYYGKIKDTADFKFLNKYVEFLLQALNPIAPHITEELINVLVDKQLYNKTWPSYDEELLNDKKISMAIQINGKVRGFIEVSQSESQNEDVCKKLAEGIVQKYLNEVKKTIFIKERCLNFIG